MFKRTSDLNYPTPADLNGWDRSVDRAAANHSSLLLGVYLGAAAPSSSGAAMAASPDELRFQLLPQPQFAASPTPRPESVLGRLNRGGSFLPKLASPLDPHSDAPNAPGNSGPPDSFSAGEAGDYLSADPLDGLWPSAGDRSQPQAALDSATGPSASDEPAWPDALFHQAQSAAGSAEGSSQPTDSATADAGASPTTGAAASPAGGARYGAGVLPPPKVIVNFADSVKLKQEMVRAIAVDFNEQNQQQFNEIKRSMSYYEASIRAMFR